MLIAILFFISNCLVVSNLFSQAQDIKATNKVWNDQTLSVRKQVLIPTTKKQLEELIAKRAKDQAATNDSPPTKQPSQDLGAIVRQHQASRRSLESQRKPNLASPKFAKVTQSESSVDDDDMTELSPILLKSSKPTSYSQRQETKPKCVTLTPNFPS